MRDVGDEVPAGLVEPAGRRLVPGQDEHPVAGERRHRDVHVEHARLVGGTAPQHEVLLLRGAPLPEQLDEGRELGMGESVGEHEVELERPDVGTDHVTPAVEDDGGVRHGREHPGLVLAHRTALGHVLGTPLPLAHVEREGGHRTDEEAEQGGDDHVQSGSHMPHSRGRRGPFHGPSGGATECSHARHRPFTRP